MKNKPFLLLVALTIFSMVILSFFVGFAIVAPTGSMRPTINDFDIVILTKVYDRSDLENKIVLYKNPYSELVIHRVKIDFGSFIKTQGDNNPIHDPWLIDKTNIVGLVVFILPLPLIIITFIGIIVLVIVKRASGLLTRM